MLLLDLTKLIINFDILFNKRYFATNTKALKSYRYFLAATFIFYIFDILWGYLDPLDKWTFDGNDKWSYNDVLKVGESAEFEVFFKTLTWGYKVNTAVAGNNITNETVNSTNHTCVGNCTPCNNETKNDTNKTPDQPDKPDQPVPHKPVVPKRNMLLPTGNPLFALVLVLIIVGLSPIRRKK